MKRLTTIFLIAATSFIACNNAENKSNTNESSALNSITEGGFIKTVKDLSSDEFQGRMPFTEGETKTINYIKEQFLGLGLKPGNGTSFFQEVPLVEITSHPNSELVFQGKDGKISLKHADDFVMGSRQVKENI